LEGDPEAKCGSIIAKIYLEILKEYLPTLMDADTIFMQDNAPIRDAGKVKKFIVDMAFELLDWLPYSPDLNCIENLWKLLKEKINAWYPELGTLPKNESSLQKLISAAIEVWEQFDIELINQLIDSMPRRIAAVVAAKGWYTKY
jgi:transposase